MTDAEKIERYKKLAAPALRDAALERLLKKARNAAVGELAHLPEDEREALEGALGVTLKHAAGKTVLLTLSGEALRIEL